MTRFELLAAREFEMPYSRKKKKVNIKEKMHENTKGKRRHLEKYPVKLHPIGHHQRNAEVRSHMTANYSFLRCSPRLLIATLEMFEILHR